MRLLALIGFLAIIIALAAGVFFFGGYYNIAATQTDLPPVAWALETVREASIGRHAATELAPFALDDPATIQAGARAFAAQGCINCHGGPGVQWAKFSEGLRPDPPDLKDVVNDMQPAEFFWVIKNGINMTGMPSFARAGASDDDIWRIVAFIKKLPSVSEADFKAWTAAPTPAAPAAPSAPQQ